MVSGMSQQPSPVAHGYPIPSPTGGQAPSPTSQQGRYGQNNMVPPPTNLKPMYPVNHTSISGTGTNGQGIGNHYTNRRPSPLQTGSKHHFPMNPTNFFPNSTGTNQSSAAVGSNQQGQGHNGPMNVTSTNKWGGIPMGFRGLGSNNPNSTPSNLPGPPIPALLD